MQVLMIWLLKKRIEGYNTQSVIFYMGYGEVRIVQKDSGARSFQERDYR